MEGEHPLGEGDSEGFQLSSMKELPVLTVDISVPPAKLRKNGCGPVMKDQGKHCHVPCPHRKLLRHGPGKSCRKRINFERSEFQDWIYFLFLFF